MTLEGWILDSGQHPEIAQGDRILSALEICTIATRGAAERSLETVGPSSGSPVAVTARITDITPRITTVNIDVPAYAASSMIEKVLGPNHRHITSVGDQFEAVVTLGVDPYFGRERPSWMPTDVIRPWVVTRIRRRDTSDQNYRSVTTTAPHSASSTFELVLSAERPRSQHS